MRDQRSSIDMLTNYAATLNELVTQTKKPSEVSLTRSLQGSY
jgi:hypothetical protein